MSKLAPAFCCFWLFATGVASQTPVTFSGSGTGPFMGNFESGSVVATASGVSLSPGGMPTIIVNNNLSFEPDQIVSINDNGNNGVSITYQFTNALFGIGDAFLVTSVGGERDVTVESQIFGNAVDANWQVRDVIGDPLVFDDDGAGINATLSGVMNNPAGVLLTPTVNGIDTLILSWRGNGSSNYGLISGLLSGPTTQLIKNGSFEVAGPLQQTLVEDPLDPEKFTAANSLPGVINHNTGNGRLVTEAPYYRDETDKDTVYTLNNGSTALAYWTTVSAAEGDTTDWVHSLNYAATDGVRSMDLNGTPGPGGVAQTVDVVPGTRYLLEFDLAGNPRGLEDISADQFFGTGQPPTAPESFTVSIEADVDGAKQAFAFEVTDQSPTAPGWQRQSWELNAFDDEMLLQLLSTTDPLYIQPDVLVDFGPVIDNVSLVEIGVAGDYNSDGAVDAADYTVWRDNFGVTGLLAFSGADGNGDGDVSAEDYQVWHTNFGRGYLDNTPVNIQSVPETCSLSLFTLTFGVAIVAIRPQLARSHQA